MNRNDRQKGHDMQKLLIAFICAVVSMPCSTTRLLRKSIVFHSKPREPVCADAPSATKGMPTYAPPLFKRCQQSTKALLCMLPVPATPSATSNPIV